MSANNNTFLKILLCLVPLLPLPLSASNEVQVPEEQQTIAELMQRIAALETLLGEQQQNLQHLRQAVAQAQQTKEQAPQEEKESALGSFAEGLKLTGGITMIAQHSPDANTLNELDEGAPHKSITDASYSIDLIAEKRIGDDGIAFLHIETGNGAGIEDELSVFSNVNRDADNSDDSLALTEVWYGHNFDALPLYAEFGKIDATVNLDTNAYANDETQQFLGHPFRNSPTIDFPDDNTAGVRSVWSPHTQLDIEFMALDANADWEDIMDDLFLAAQLTFKPEFGDGLEGNWRVYSWQNQRDGFRRWVALESNEESPSLWSVPEEQATDNPNAWGWGLSIDQQLSASLGLLVRYGQRNPEICACPDGYDENVGGNFPVDRAWSMGLVLDGGAWLREEDTLGIAVAQLLPSDKYADALGQQADPEWHLEAYYRWQLNEYLSVSPDVQWIGNPLGKDATADNGNLLIFGVRSQVDF